MECKLPDYIQEDPNQTVTFIKIYRDEHSNADSVLVGFKGKSHFNSGVILIKRPSKLQLLIDRIKSFFRKKKHNRIELYAKELNNLARD